MTIDARSLIRELALSPHPEGGWYRELFRSARRVIVDGAEKSALTTILYLLEGGEHSCWHRVDQDEAWHFYDGDALELVRVDPEGMRGARHRLGRRSDGCEVAAVIPALHWQAARCTGRWSLVGCTMGPGFEFADFVLLRDHPLVASALAAHHPEWVGLL